MDNLVSKLIREGLILHRDNLKLRSGQLSDVYFDLKTVCGENPGIRNELADRLYKKFQGITCVAGFGHGGIPIATTISSFYSLPLTTIRDRRKDHGTEKLIEGYVPGREDKIALVDDVFTSGSSLREAIGVIRRETDAKRIFCYVVINRNDNNPDRLALLPNNVTETYPLHHIFTKEDFFK